jgi:predicted permease
VAIGIAAVTATFSIASGLLLRPLPLPAQDRVIVMWAKQRDFAHVPLKWSDVERYGKESRACTRVAGIDYNGAWTWALSDRGEAVPAKGTYVTGGLFQTLGISPQLGRVITERDDVPNAPRVAVISDALWRRRYGADSTVIGRVLEFDRTQITIVGVAPRGFEYPHGVEFWTPVRAFAPNVPADSIPSSLDLVARLNPDATMDQARRELDGYLDRAYARFRTSVGTFEATARTLPDAIIGTVRPAVLTLTAAAVLVLVIACLNVANLQLVRGVARVREVAIRASLGASTARVVRQLLTEAGVIGVAGAAAGITLAALTIRALVALAPAEIPRVAEVTLDAEVMVFATVVTIVTVALSAIGPTLALARSDVASLVRRAGTRAVAGSRRSARTRQGLIGAQAALAVLVLSGAGLLIRSLANLQHQDLGFRRENVVVAQLTMPWSKFDTPDGSDRFNQLLERVRATVAATAGVTHVAVASSPPYSGTGGWDALPSVEGQSADAATRRPWVNMEIVTPDYFATLGVPLLRGRLLASTDRKGAEPAIVVNATMARLYWPGEDPLGKRLRLGAPTDSAASRYTVVGVVGDMRYRELTVAMPSFYIPNEQLATGVATFFLVRTTSAPAAIVPTIRAIFRNADADASLLDARTLDDYLAGPLARPRFVSALVAFFGVAGLLLVAVGIYAVVAEHVRDHHRELGIRIALGARAADLRRFVLRVGLTPLMVGAVVGLGLSLASGRLVKTLLYRVTPTDPVPLGGVVAIIAAAAFAACAVPLRQARRVDPVEVLRADNARSTYPYAARAAPSAYRRTRMSIALSPTSRVPSPMLSMIVRTKSSGIASVVSGGWPLIALKRILKNAAIVGDWRMFTSA